MGRGNVAVFKALAHISTRRGARLLGACTLLAGVPMLLGAGNAQAAQAAQAVACGPPIQAPTPCTMTGTLTLISGSLTLAAPTALEWSGQVTGLDQHLVDTVGGEQTYVVNEATGAAPGWHVLISATTFKTAGNAVLPNSGTFVTNGSLTSVTSTAAPSATCTSGSTCLLPSNLTTYPVAITTAATTPVDFDIYETNIGTGQGAIVIGGSSAPNPVGWWLNLPSNILSGTYTSTITMSVVAGP